MAKRLSKPVTGLGMLVNFWRKASLRLCAGSVEMMSTFLLAAASCTARLQRASSQTLFTSVLRNSKLPADHASPPSHFGACR